MWCAGLAGLALIGCMSAAADHERLGDHAYREGRFLAAVAEYRAALRSGAGAPVWAKLGSAALQERQLATAIEAFSALQKADPDRATEAAIGLERVAQLADRSGGAVGGTSQGTYLAGAVRALRAVAPGRPLGRWALSTGAALDPTEALEALPAALASATAGRTVDSLLVAYGEAQRVTTACEAATRTFRTVLRRTRLVPLRNTAASGLGSCALRLGLDALGGNQADVAEHWFEAALGAVPGSDAGWRAEIGLGDARLAQGDVLGAALAYQSVLAARALPDSLRGLATEKLNALAAPPAAPASTPGARR